MFAANGIFVRTDVPVWWPICVLSIMYNKCECGLTVLFLPAMVHTITEVCNRYLPVRFTFHIKEQHDALSLGIFICETNING